MRTLAFFLLLSSAQALDPSAVPCAVSWQVGIAGAPVAKPPTVVSDCRTLKIESGPAIVKFFRDGGLEEPGTVFYTGQAVVVPSTVVRAPQGTWQRFAALYRTVFGNETSTRNGSSRGLAEYLQVILPHGSVLPRPSPLTIDLEGPDLPPITGFAIRYASGTGDEVFSTKDIGNRLQIPSNVLSPGLEYIWTVSTGDRQLQNTFRVEDPDEIPARVRTIALEVTSGRVGPEDVVSRGAVLFAAGFEFDARQIATRFRAR
jgi:hypothetical protein